MSAFVRAVCGYVGCGRTLTEATTRKHAIAGTVAHCKQHASLHRRKPPVFCAVCAKPIAGANAIARARKTGVPVFCFAHSPTRRPHVFCAWGGCSRRASKSTEIERRRSGRPYFCAEHRRALREKHCHGCGRSVRNASGTYLCRPCAMTRAWERPAYRRRVIAARARARARADGRNQGCARRNPDRPDGRGVR